MQEKLASSIDTQNNFWWEEQQKSISIIEFMKIFTVKKILINYYKVYYFLVKAWHGFLCNRQGKLINLKFIS